MAGEVKLKLSVWRDFTPTKSLVFSRENRQVVAGDSDLQQEIYAWQTKEDPFDGVSNEEARSKLRSLLLDRFEASQAPADRAITALQEFIDSADDVIESNQAEWMLSQDMPSEDEDIPFRLNPLLALKLHLEWLVSMFSGQPGISVSVR